MNGELVHTVRRGAGFAPAGQVLVLGVLDASVGIGPAGWVAGMVCGLLVTAFLAVGLTGSDAGGLGPADRVTLARAVLVGGVAALTADAVAGTGAGSARVGTLVAMASVALVLDWVDGQVARRTATASELGSRLDMETDALLILVLSVYAADETGPWVLVIGAARYLRMLACMPWPWMRREAPPRYWAKVVAAVQGIVLTVAAADVVPAPLMTAVLAGALVLLAESFGREAWWLRRHRHLGDDIPAHAPAPVTATGARR